MGPKNLLWEVCTLKLGLQATFAFRKIQDVTFLNFNFCKLLNLYMSCFIKQWNLTHFMYPYCTVCRKYFQSNPYARMVKSFFLIRVGLSGWWRHHWRKYSSYDITIYRTCMLSYQLLRSLTNLLINTNHRTILPHENTDFKSTIPGIF